MGFTFLYISQSKTATTVILPRHLRLTFEDFIKNSGVQSIIFRVANTQISLQLFLALTRILGLYKFGVCYFLRALQKGVHYLAAFLFIREPYRAFFSANRNILYFGLFVLIKRNFNKQACLPTLHLGAVKQEISLTVNNCPVFIFSSQPMQCEC